MQSERDTKEEIAKVFALFDPDAHGRITFRELKKVISELGENISDEEMREMIEEADRDHDGECLTGGCAATTISPKVWVGMTHTRHAA